MCLLAEHYYNGLGCDKMVLEAIKLFKKSADKGNALAQQRLQKLKL